MRQGDRWRATRTHTTLSLLALCLPLLLQACNTSSSSSSYNTNSTKGKSGNVGVSGNARFTGNLIFVKQRNIFILHGKDGSLTQLTSNSDTLQPALSPDHTTLAFEVRKPNQSYSDLATMPLTGGAMTLHTDNSVHFKGDGSPPFFYQFWANNPIWSSDGQNLIYLSDFFKGGATTPNYPNQTCYDNSQINYVQDMGIVEMSASAPATPAVESYSRTNPPKLLAWPYCSAGGDQDVSLRPGNTNDTELLFTSFKYVGDKNDLVAQISLLIIPENGPERLIQLSPEDPAAVPLEPSWSPKGDAITYVRRENGQDNLYIMPIDTTVSGAPNDESYIIDQRGTRRSVYYTNTTYYAASQKLAEGIIGNPVWMNDKQIIYMQYASGEFNLFLATLKFSDPALPIPTPTGTPTDSTPTALTVPTIKIDGTPVQVTQGGVDGESRPVWFP